MSSSVLSQFALDDVVDGSSPDLTSIPHSRASKKPRANQIEEISDDHILEVYGCSECLAGKGGTSERWRGNGCV
jgi:hypothetical protein